VNKPDDINITPMMRAVEVNKVDMIRALFDLDADVDLVDHAGYSLVSLAAKHGHVDAIRTFDEFEADLNTLNRDNETPLVVAMHESRIDVIKMLAKCGADLNTPYDNSHSLLYIAARDDCVDTTRALGNAGVDMTITDCTGWTPVHTCSCFKWSYWCYYNTCRAKRVDINLTDSDRDSPLSYSVQNIIINVSTFLVNIGPV
jgi:ankyrin repeat protein